MMPRSWRQTLAVGGLVWLVLAGMACLRRPDFVRAETGVWFEPVTFRSAELDGVLSESDLRTVASVTRAEVGRAFTGLRIVVTDSRDAPYRVRIVESVRDPRFRSDVEVAGASWGTTGGRGHGAVSFRFLASGALAQAPPGADRATKLEAIGRGIGRSVVHELVHQFFPSEAMHSNDPDSYEFESASRRSQYYGDMHWSVAWPLLQRRFGAGATPAASPPN